MARAQLAQFNHNLRRTVPKEVQNCPTIVSIERCPAANVVCRIEKGRKHSTRREAPCGGRDFTKLGRLSFDGVYPASTIAPSLATNAIGPSSKASFELFAFLMHLRSGSGPEIKPSATTRPGLGVIESQ